MSEFDRKSAKKRAEQVIATEAKAISQLSKHINDDFVTACEHLLNCSGRVVVLGMGKSGHIGNKIAATLASTGTPAFFVHPGEAMHGDLGMICDGDVVLALSYSGETEEVVNLLPVLQQRNLTLISLTGNADSCLATQSNVHIDVGVKQEACPLDLAPTSSTTATLVMGDAIAITLLEARGFTADDFARTHPGGSLGKRLLLGIRDSMRTGDAIPSVTPDTMLDSAILEITNKRMGMTTIVNSKRELMGVFTDGDIRRCIDQGNDFHTTAISDVMHRDCKTTSVDTLAIDALNLMEAHKITSLVVTDDKNKPIGVVHLHDLLSEGL